MGLKPPAACAECGSDPIYHRLTYVTIVVDEIGRRVFSTGALTRFAARALYAIERRTTPAVLTFLTWLGLAKRQTRIDEYTMLLAEMLWKEGEARGITVWEWRLFGLPRNIYVANLPDGRSVAYEGIPSPPWGIEIATWTDNKAEMKNRFRKLGYPVARGGHAFSEAGALKIYRALEAPVIVKPHSGSGSRHTILHIDSEEELLRAFRIATQVSPFAIIEEELRGAVYRATVVDGVFVAALRRDPPSVVGDGVRTVSDLVEEENRHPARGGPYFSKIQLNDAALEELAWQGLTLESVPEAGRRVQFHQKVNWSLGGTTSDVTDSTHPDNVALFEAVAKTLRAPIVGLDFIIGDMNRPWKEQERCGIIECNSMPFFDNHHLPYEGEPRNVAGAIWDMVERSI